MQKVKIVGSGSLLVLVLAGHAACTGELAAVAEQAEPQPPDPLDSVQNHLCANALQPGEAALARCALPADEVLQLTVRAPGQAGQGVVAFYTAGGSGEPVQIAEAGDVRLDDGKDDGVATLSAELFRDAALTTTPSFPLRLEASDEVDGRDTDVLYARVGVQPSAAGQALQGVLCLDHVVAGEGATACVDLVDAGGACPAGAVDLDGDPDNGCECAAQAEACDGIDNDCDAGIDEGDNGCGGACGLAAPPGSACDAPRDLDALADDAVVCLAANEVACVDAGLDADGDGFAPGADGPTGDCDDADPAVHPDQLEACNAIDDDCDGDADEAVEHCVDGMTFRGELYGVVDSSGSVVRIDEGGALTSVGTAKVGGEDWGLGYDPTEDLFYAMPEGGPLVRFDPEDGTSVELGGAGLSIYDPGLAFDHQSGTMYLVSEPAVTWPTLYVVDLATGELDTVGDLVGLSVGFGNMGATFDPFTGTLWVSSTGGGLYAVDTETVEATRVCPEVAVKGTGLAFNLAERTVYAADYLSDQDVVQITVVDPVACTTSAFAPVIGNVQGIEFR
jgi:hypothetical protein